MSDDTESLISIDENALDREWCNQATRFYDTAVQLADARAELATQKTTVDLVEAELSLKIRTSPSQYTDVKITESVIESLVLTRPAYQQAMTDLDTARHKVDVLQAAVSALDHRKSALENLVKLHGMSYFAQPKESGQEMGRTGAPPVKRDDLKKKPVK